MKEKTKKRIVSASVESVFIGEEPKWDNPRTTLISALNWYANQSGPKESKKYTLDHIKKEKYSKSIIEKVSSIDEVMFSNIGFVCRILDRGAEIDKKEWVKEKIHSLIKTVEAPAKVSEFAKKAPTTTIQDRIFEQSSIYIADIDGYVDDFIKTRKVPEFNPYDWMISNLVKSIHAKQIQTHFSSMLDELKLAYDKKDEDLVEGYSSYKKTELKNFIKFLQSIVDDCSKIIDNSKLVKKPRKKKVVSVDKKVAKVQYKKEDVEYKLASISPTEIIGATQLWVFNTKYKRLGLYKSVDESGFSIKGTTIEGFDTVLSVQKTLRKPLDTLNDFKKAKKPELKKFLNNITCKESTLNGRLNSDTILLKVIK